MFVSNANEPRVTWLHTPDGGLQPRAAVDARGILHLVYFKGDPKAGDLFYVRAPASAEPRWSQPVRVNSTPGAAMAIGTIRGAQIALGKNDRVHVAWNGSGNAPKFAGSAPMFYTRLNDAGTAFEPERNVITWAGGLDGGGSIAADRAGNVFVVWHAQAGAKDETGRAVFAAKSRDDGATFSREEKISASPTGACGCCGLSAITDGAGSVFVLYRAAVNQTSRDTTLLAFTDHGPTLTSAVVGPWEINMCPMSSHSFAASERSVYAAWETAGQIVFGKIDGGKIARPIPVPGDARQRKHPSLALNSRGEILLAWTEGTGWNKGGAAASQIFSADGRELFADKRPDAVPPWSLVSAFALPDGNFAIIF